MLRRLKTWASAIKRDVVALWLAGRDPRVSTAAKLVSAAVAAYALSPIDLIPDFVPVLGYLDDLLIVPAGILLAVKLIPQPIMFDLRQRALAQGRPTSKVGPVAVVMVWLLGSALAVWLFWLR